MVEQNTLRLEVVAMYKKKNSLEYLVGNKEVSNMSLPPFENIICNFFKTQQFWGNTFHGRYQRFRRPHNLPIETRYHDRTGKQLCYS